MKKFEAPEMEVMAFEVADILTASGYVPGQGNGNFGGDIGGED